MNKNEECEFCGKDISDCECDILPNNWSSISYDE